MTLSDTIQSAFTALKAHKMRSTLTMLGIIIGVGSVVLMVSVGSTLQTYILDQLDSLGGNVIDLYPTGLEKFGRKLDTITEDDYTAITRLTTVESVAPIIFITKPVVYGTEQESPLVFGTTKEIFSNYGLSLKEGRLLTDADVDRGNAVVVLGHETAENLFDTRDPIGNKVTIGSRSYEVVGVLKAAGSPLLSELDTPVYVPYTVAKAATGQKHLNFINLRAKGDGDLTLLDINSLLRQRHKINNPENDLDKDDFMARSTEQATEIIGTVTLGLSIFLGLIAGISLLVGGIGIMNIMLVSVSERTLEIGLRKAVGARRRDILLQFLVEAVWLTILGGIVGLIGASFMGYVIALAAGQFVGEVRYIVSIPSILAALTMAIGTGLAFGIYPARKAASLSPMEAMRRE